MNPEKSALPNTSLARDFLGRYNEALEMIGHQVIGLDSVIENVFIAMLADGHVILEGEPGVGKTLVARTIAETIDIDSSYIQFTPETMPSDLFYSMGIFSDEGSGKSIREMSMMKGPVFSRMVIGDEINRAVPRIHAALLSPLEERIITLEGEEHDLQPFYFWIATQNPVESSETTGQLPEALQERFLLMVHVSYPGPDLLRRIAVHDTRPGAIKKIFSIDEIVTIRDAIFDQYVVGLDKDNPVVSYVQRLINAVHDHPVVRLGPGIRAAQDLMRTSAAHAFLYNRAVISFDDVKALALPVLRFKFQYDIRAARRYYKEISSNDDVVKDVISSLKIA